MKPIQELEMIDDAELARRSILGFGRCSRRSGVGVLWVPSALSRRKLSEERWAEVRRVFDRLQEALDDGQVEEFYTMRLGCA